MSKKNPLAITDVVLRDAHQSIFATRLRLQDMLPIAAALDKIGYWSIESWGGATFDACIRYLGEDPWERIRALKAAMPNTPQQMLFRGQNILGYRHYADDVVHKFVERCAVNGVDVFRIFDAMNDTRNLQTAIEATKAVERHAQGTMSYTVSPVHTLDTWLDMGKQLEDMGCDSICIKDMAGLLKPYVAEKLIRHLKKSVDIPIALHCHATTGMSTATILKASEAGIDMVDTSISSMSMTYGHSPTESVVSILEDTDRDTGIDIKALESIAAYFKEVRKKYAKFAGSLQGVDSRILVAQVPGGMLTNMENQLKDQNALDKMDEVLKEIPRVRKDLGYIPLVTPTSQIVGTQAVMNVMFGERYKSISKETAGILKGEYGATAAPVNETLQKKVLEGAEPISVRPADLLQPEMDKLTDELLSLASKENIQLADDVVDDVLTYALFPQVGLKFLKNRHNPDAFEPVPGSEAADSDQHNLPAPASQKDSVPVGDTVQYRVVVNTVPYEVEVSPLGSVSSITTTTSARIASVAKISGTGKPLPAPLSGNILKILVNSGQPVGRGDVLLILEAMKMETQVRAVDSGNVSKILVKEGDTVQVGDPLMTIA